jgi:hypothetical protein
MKAIITRDIHKIIAITVCPGITVVKEISTLPAIMNYAVITDYSIH